MYSVHPVNNSGSKEERLTLELLDAIERRSDVSQRHLARQMGVALGLANSYLKRCAKKGLVKVREAPANRYVYYLTPKGFAEKARLTAQFLSTSLSFYRQAAESCTKIYEHCEKQGWNNIVLCGKSDLAEIAFMRAIHTPVSILGLWDPDQTRASFFNREIWNHWERIPDTDAYVITGLSDPLRLYEFVLSKTTDPERVITPEVLGLRAAAEAVSKKQA